MPLESQQINLAPCVPALQQYQAQIAASVACEEVDKPIKAVIIPQTVPSRPIYGETEAILASNGNPLLKLELLTPQANAKFALHAFNDVATVWVFLSSFKNSLKPIKKDLLKSTSIRVTLNTFV